MRRTPDDVFVEGVVSVERGREGEALAESFLAARGWKILERNWRSLGAAVLSSLRSCSSDTRVLLSSRRITRAFCIVST